MNPERTRPSVTVFTMGGTIASTTTNDRHGVIPQLDADTMIGAVPDLATVARLDAVAFRQKASGDLRLEDIVSLADEIERSIGAGAAGVVVTQGTDTLEETAFALDVLLSGDSAVVITGAMRNPTLPGADGPANLLAAVQVAASDKSRGLGCLVVFGDEVHCARFVRKTHTTSPATFHSPSAGPIGWVTEGVPRISLVPRQRTRPVPRTGGELPRVALLTLGIGEQGHMLRFVEDSGYEGLVVEGFGGGHVPGHLAESLGELAQRLPVVLSSRTGAGEVLAQTYGFVGSEIDLLARGLISAGPLDGLKARILLTFALAQSRNPSDLRRVFEDRHDAW